MDMATSEAVRVDRKNWPEALRALYQTPTNDEYFSLRPEFYPFFKTLGKPPVVDHLASTLFDQWGDNLDEAINLAQRLDHLGASLGWGMMGKTFHHSSVAVTAHMHYLGTGGRCYNFEASLTGYEETAAMVAEKAGLSRNAAMLVTEKMLMLHYAPSYARLGVVSNSERGWTLHGCQDPELDKYLGNLAATMEYLLEAQRSMDDIITAARSHMGKRQCEQLSSYTMGEQLFCALSPRWAQLHRKEGTSVHERLKRAIDHPMFRGRVRSLRAIMDKLVLCAMGAAELKEVMIDVDHASVTIRKPII